MNAMIGTLLAVLIFLVPGPGDASPPSPFGPGGAGPGAGLTAPQFFDSRDEVKASAKSPLARVPRGSEFPIAVIFDINRGWHIWTQAGGTPEGVGVFDGAINTEIKVRGVEPAAAANTFDEFTQWPPPHVGPVSGLASAATFDGRAIAYVPVSIAADAPLGSVTLTFALTFQACDATTCIAPVFDYEVPVTFEVVDDANLDVAATVRADKDFNTFESDVFERIGVAPLDDEGDSATTQPQDEDPGEPATESGIFLGWKLPSFDGPLGLLVLVLLSMVGGFILNLTPCVLPVIPIKVLTISQHAGTPGRSLALGLWMAAGVVAFWAGIGLPVAFVAGMTDPSRIFGIWWVTLGIGLVIALMGIGIMGLFTIQLPQAVYMVNPKADSPGGSFLFGVMTAVLGLPCFGFVAGALLAGAATLPAGTVMLIFTSLGVGMASPYLVLAAKPSLVERIPRTGPASELVKQVMGLLLLAAAAYFVGSGFITLVIDYPYLGKQLHWWVVATLAVAAGAWLLVRTVQITPRVGRRIAFGVIGAVLGAAAVLFALDRTASARLDWERLAASEGAADNFVAGGWNQYTPARFEKARAAGHIVVLDFTASWCLTCQALRATVLDPEPVKSAFESPDVVVFEVDVSSVNAPGWQTLRDLGKTGIPLLAIYGPGDEQPWLANAYTPQQVIDALDAARSHTVARR